MKKLIFKYGYEEGFEIYLDKVLISDTELDEIQIRDLEHLWRALEVEVAFDYSE